MHFIPLNTRQLSCKIIGLAFLSVIISNRIVAQSVEPLPDSVKAVEDTVVSSVVAEGDSPKTIVIVPDTAVLRSVPDSVIQRYKKDKDFAYANDAAYWAKEPEDESHDKNFLDYFWAFITSKGVRIFVYLLIAAVLLFALYRIVVDNKLYLFYSPPKKLIVGETSEADMQNENIEEKIEQAMQAMDYRLAVRWMHLKALRLLNKKELIRFHAQGTNQEYLSQLSNHKEAKNFQYLTHVYDYAWYGGFTLTQQQAETMQQNFNRFYSAIEN
jgi:hypothetical protein